MEKGSNRIRKLKENANDFDFWQLQSEIQKDKDMSSAPWTEQLWHDICTSCRELKSSDMWASDFFLINLCFELLFIPSVSCHSRRY